MSSKEAEMAEYKVRGCAVLSSGKVWSDTILVKGNVSRDNALGKARRMLELWKGADNVRRTAFWFADDPDSVAEGESSARLMLREAEARGEITA